MIAIIGLYLNVFFQISIPLIIFYSLIFRRFSCQFLYVFEAIAALLLIIFINIMVRWEIIGIHVRTILMYLFPVVVIAGFYINRQKPVFCPWTHGILFELGVCILINCFLAYLILLCLTVPPVERAIHLEFPFKNRDWVIAQGGNCMLVNHHKRVRGQSYALDISLLNSVGRRAQGLYPSNPEKYETFGKSVYAPCNGLVVALEKNREDLVASLRDTDHPAGNYVAIYSGIGTVILAHLQKGSIKVSVGDRITIGSLIALAGNSGNTTEPHLHIHAVKGNITDINQLLYTGTPVPILFDNRFLRKGATNWN